MYKKRKNSRALPPNDGAKKLKAHPDKAVIASDPISNYSAFEPITAEYCNIHRRPSFTVIAMAYNSKIRVLCVVRRLDSSEEE